ncbi:MAG: hypothetical protein V1880_00580 [Patescibacteria group bacterium]
MKNIHVILKPTYYYLIVLAVFYFFRDVLLFPRTELWLSVPFNLTVEVIMPLVLFIVNLILIRMHYKNARRIYVFVITGIPGFLIGTQAAYGFIGGILSGKAGFLLLDQITIIFVGLLFGSVFGLIGILLNKIITMLSVK